MSSKLRSILVEIISAVFILVFLYAAVSKLADHDQFASTLAKSPLLHRISPILSWVLPFIEIIISAFLLLPISKRLGLFLSLILMTIFTFYIAHMLLFSSDLPCSCGGVLTGLGWKKHLVFNIILTILAIVGWRLASKNKVFIAINRISRTPVEDSRHY